MSDSEDTDEEDFRITCFHETTARLVEEIVQKTGQPSMVKHKSFKKLVRYLNPIAKIPRLSSEGTVIIKESSSVLNRCIECDLEDDGKMVPIAVDHAVIVLTRLVIQNCRDKTEAARRLRRTSFKICVSHFATVVEDIFKCFKIETSRNLMETSFRILEEWSTVFTQIKMIREWKKWKKEENAASEFLIILQNFIKMVHHRQENENPINECRREDIGGLNGVNQEMKRKLTPTENENLAINPIKRRMITTVQSQISFPEVPKK